MIVAAEKLRSIVMTIFNADGTIKLKKKAPAIGGCNATPFVSNYTTPNTRLAVYYGVVDGCDFYATFTVGKHTVFEQSFKILMRG